MKPIRGILLIAFGLLVSINSFAQMRQLQKTDSVLALVKKYFKTKDADSIYALTGAEYKKSISQGIFRNICFRELFPLGAIKKDSLLTFINNRTATYKLQFEAVTMQLLLDLDQDDKIHLFQFQPYREAAINKPRLVASSNPLVSVIDKKVDSAARLYIQKSNTVGLSIGVIKDGKISTYNYGETTKGNGKLPTTGTIYEIGSITKTFTAALLAWYVNEGKVSLSDPITKYLPDSVAANPELKKITLANLSNHTSGLPGLPANFYTQQPYDQLNPYKNYTKQLLYAYLKNCTLNSVPGQKYKYSNLGVGLLGDILERVSGKSFEQMVSEIICAPLGLKNTVQHIYPAILPRFATVYNEDGAQTPAWDFNGIVANGALKSTIDDLLLYTKANMYTGTGKLAKAFELTHHITYDSDMKVGLGWHIIKPDVVSYYYHNGGTGGSSCFLAYNTEKNIAVVILSNAVASTDMVGQNILKALQ